MKKTNILLLFIVLMVACKTEKKTINNKVEIAYKIAAKLGEGAIWNYKTGEFYWIDIEDKKLHILNPEKKENKTIEMPCKIGTVVPSEEEGKAVVALEDGIYIVDINTKEILNLSDIESDEVDQRFNDGKCDPNGNLWVGSINFKKEPNASLYKVDEKGKVNKMLGGITISNGIVWTKDKKIMYYIDTPTGKIKAFDFNITDSTISNGRVVIEVNEKDGFPDGMAIDENDMLWVGMWNGNAVIQYNPKTGELVRKIEVPAHNVTACAFGGENLDELYITTASVDMTEEEKKKYPLAGSVFKVKLNTKGVKSTFFKKPIIEIAQLN